MPSNYSPRPSVIIPITSRTEKVGNSQRWDKVKARPRSSGSIFHLLASCFHTRTCIRFFTAGRGRSERGKSARQDVEGEKKQGSRKQRHKAFNFLGVFAEVVWVCVFVCWWACKVIHYALLSNGNPQTHLNTIGKRTSVNSRQQNEPFHFFSTGKWKGPCQLHYESLRKRLIQQLFHISVKAIV